MLFELMCAGWNNVGVGIYFTIKPYKCMTTERTNQPGQYPSPHPPSSGG